MRISYLEIYNEEVRDLLGKEQTARLEVKERPDIGVYVKDLNTFAVNNADDMDRLMEKGNKNRVVSFTYSPTILIHPLLLLLYTSITIGHQSKSIMSSLPKKPRARVASLKAPGSNLG